MTEPTSDLQYRVERPVTDPLELEADAPLTEDEAGYVEAARAANTLRGYRSDWAEFTGWCAGRGLDRRAALGRYPAGRSGRRWAGCGSGVVRRRRTWGGGVLPGPAAPLVAHVDPIRKPSAGLAPAPRPWSNRKLKPGWASGCAGRSRYAAVKPVMGYAGG